MSRGDCGLLVQLSIYERLLNALSRVRHKRTDDCITRDLADVAAMKSVIEPELLAARTAGWKEGAEAMQEKAVMMAERSAKGWYETYGDAPRCRLPSGSSAQEAAEVIRALPLSEPSKVDP